MTANRPATLLSSRWRCLAAVAAVACLSTAAQAGGRWSVGLDVGLPFGQPIGQPFGYGDGHGWGGAPGDVNPMPSGAVSVQVGGGRYRRQGGNWHRPWGSRWILVAPAIVVPLAQSAPLAVQPAATLVPEPSRPDPVIEPRHGQDAQQTEHDRQQCNRWATTQPAALADAVVFQRAVADCMDGRGYTLR